MLVETGTHLIVDALICPYRMGERVRALKLLRSVAEGMLLMWDARTAFLCHGPQYADYWLSLLGTGAEEREIRGGACFR